MYRRVMVGYNGTEEALDALALGQSLSTAMGAELILGGVVHMERYGLGFGDWRARAPTLFVPLWRRRPKAARNSPPL